MARIVSRAVILVLGAGYIGAKVAELALARGERVVLADNWHATRSEQVEPLSAEIHDVDVRRRVDVDKFRRVAAAGKPLTLDDGGRATIGVVHVEDAARLLLDAADPVANVVAETVTVAQVAALARGEDPGAAPAPRARFVSHFRYD